MSYEKRRRSGVRSSPLVRITKTFLFAFLIAGFVIADLFFLGVGKLRFAGVGKFDPSFFCPRRTMPHHDVHLQESTRHSFDNTSSQLHVSF